MVERGSHVVDTIPKDESPPDAVRLFEKPDPQNVNQAIRVLLTNEEMGITVGKTLDFTPERFQMFIGPAQFAVNPPEGWHG
jgi:hypothetical protein